MIRLKSVGLAEDYKRLDSRRANDGHFSKSRSILFSHFLPRSPPAAKRLKAAFFKPGMKIVCPSIPNLQSPRRTKESKFRDDVIWGWGING